MKKDGEKTKRKKGQGRGYGRQYRCIYSFTVFGNIRFTAGLVGVQKKFDYTLYTLTCFFCVSDFPISRL